MQRSRRTASGVGGWRNGEGYMSSGAHDNSKYINIVHSRGEQGRRRGRRREMIMYLVCWREEALFSPWSPRDRLTSLQMRNQSHSLTALSHPEELTAGISTTFAIMLVVQL